MSPQVPRWVGDACREFFSVLLSDPVVMSAHPTSSGCVATVGDGDASGMRAAYLAWLNPGRGVVAFSALPVPAPGTGGADAGGKRPGRSPEEGMRPELETLMASVRRGPGGRDMREVLDRLSSDPAGLDIHGLRRATGIPWSRLVRAVRRLEDSGLTLRRGRRISLHPGLTSTR